MSGCSDMEVVDYVRLPIGVENPYAIRCVQSINSQPEQLKAFEKFVQNKDVLYGYTAMLLQHEYGMCYFIPICSKERIIEGAVYSPVSFQVDNNNKIIFTDTLHNMYFVNKNFISTRIPMEQRFLYSHHFPFFLNVA